MLGIVMRSGKVIFSGEQPVGLTGMNNLCRKLYELYQSQDVYLYSRPANQWVKPNYVFRVKSTGIKKLIRVELDFPKPEEVPEILRMGVLVGAL